MVRNQSTSLQTFKTFVTIQIVFCLLMVVFISCEDKETKPSPSQKASKQETKEQDQTISEPEKKTSLEAVTVEKIDPSKLVIKSIETNSVYYLTQEKKKFSSLQIVFVLEENSPSPDYFRLCVNPIDES